MVLPHLAHVADAERRGLPIAIAAADGPAAVGQALDDGLRVHPGRRMEAAHRPRTPLCGRGIGATAGGGPLLGALLEAAVPLPARLHALGEDAVELNVQGIEQR